MVYRRKTCKKNCGLAGLCGWQGVWPPPCQRYCSGVLCDITEAWFSETALFFGTTFQQESHVLSSLPVAWIGATTQIFEEVNQQVQNDAMVWNGFWNLWLSSVDLCGRSRSSQPALESIHAGMFSFFLSVICFRWIPVQSTNTTTAMRFFHGITSRWRHLAGEVKTTASSAFSRLFGS